MAHGGRGSRPAPGVTVGEVGTLIVRFLEGQKMMRQMMGGMPGMRRAGQRRRAGQGEEEGRRAVVLAARPAAVHRRSAGAGVSPTAARAAARPRRTAGRIRPARCPDRCRPAAGGIGGWDGSLPIPAGTARVADAAAEPAARAARRAAEPARQARQEGPVTCRARANRAGPVRSAAPARRAHGRHRGARVPAITPRRQTSGRM